jgi:hypothetical protein
VADHRVGVVEALMPTRRDALRQTFAAAVGTVAFARSVSSAPAHRIQSVVRRDETLLRLGGIGDHYEMTWDAQDRLYMVVNDGPGWLDPTRGFYNSRLWTVDHHIQQPVFADVAGYPQLDDLARPEDATHYYGHGVLAHGGRIYQFLSTLDRETRRPRHWVGAKLIYSDDNGRTWRNQNGVTPVVWEDWSAQSRDSLVFFDEPDGCFSLLSIVQMGRDYRANRDGYVYVYGVNGNVDGRMNELVLFRAPIARLLDRRAYEYFGGRLANGAARWVAHIEDRAVVHTFPRGWVNHTNLFPGDLVVESWLPSVVYIEPLDSYVMASAGVGCAPDGTEFGKASYLGFWISSTPWGPWRQIHEEPAWTPGKDPEARAYAPQIAPKWIAEDGKSFWLVWADLKGMLKFAHDEPLLDAQMAKATTPEQRGTVQAEFLHRYMPSYALNAQRVDLMTG